MPMNSVQYNISKLLEAGLIEEAKSWWSVKGKKMPTYKVANKLIVISPIIGTPAYKEGIKSKDLIMKIDDKPTKDMALEEAVSHIRGRQGTKVKLAIMRSTFKELKDFIITRDKIVIKSTEYKMLPDSIAYIKFNTFEKQGAPAEFKKAILKAEKEKAAGLICFFSNAWPLSLELTHPVEYVVRKGGAHLHYPGVARRNPGILSLCTSGICT